MSEVRVMLGWRGLAVALLGLFSQAASSGAQQLTVREQTARVENVRRLYLDESAAYQRRRRAVLDTASTDTAIVGPLRVGTWRESGGVVRAGTSLAWRRMSPWFRGDSALLARGSYWVYVYGLSERRTADGFTVHATQAGAVNKGASSDDVSHRLEQLVGTDLIGRVGPAFAEWVGNSIPMAYDSATLRNAYIEMVTAPSNIAHRCFVGETGACRIALELDTMPDPAAAWYSADERVMLVARMGRSAGTPNARNQALNTCVDERDDASCLAVLRSLDRRVLRLPLSALARQSVVRVALAMGHEGAYTRLVNTKGGARAKLAAVAGVSIDSVVTVWRSEVIGARPPSDRVPPSTQWSTGFWILLLAGMALRSSRWRSA